MRSYPALAVAAVLALTLSIAAQTAPSAQQNMRQHRTRPKPTNLQVLPKDISARDLIATMHGYETELGVECSFCHARNPQTNRMDFASDANPHKSTARIMIRMVNEINSKYLATADEDAPAEEKKATCGTCHRGHSLPPPFVSAARNEHPESH